MLMSVVGIVIAINEVEENMVTTKYISTIEDVKDLVFDHPVDANGRNRGTNLYRGMPNSEYKLLTSLQRNCGSKSKQLEEKLLANFKKYTSAELEVDQDNIWALMTLGQHHGLPTRLLDWTHSPLVALSFATLEESSQLNKHDSVLWKIDYSSIHDNLPVEFQSCLKDSRIFSIDSLSTVVNTLSDYDKLVESKAMVIIEPPSLDPRIVNQYAFFSIIPSGVSDIEDFLDKHTDKTVKYIIDKKLKWRIRDFLDEVNISERTIYPGLDGICKWLARHYYVRE